MLIIDRRQQTRHILHSRQERKPILSRFAQGRRAIRRINSIVLHQTTFSRMGIDPSPEDDFDHTIAHFVVRQDGIIYRLRDYEVLLNNAHSGSSVSIEFEGNYPNIEGDYYLEDRRGRHDLRPIQASVGRHLIVQIRRELPDNQIDKIFGHVQFNPSGRANCPGPHVWYNVAVWAKNHLQMQSTGDGAGQIPDDWENARFDLFNPEGSDQDDFLPNLYLH